MSKKAPHELARCVFCEVDMIDYLQYPMRDFNYVDELCIQLYMDELGYGVNKVAVHSLKNWSGYRRS